VERREPTLAAAVRVGAELEEDAGALAVAREGRRPERAHLDEARLRERLEVGAPLDEQPGRRRSAREAREVERREAVGRKRVRLLRIAVEDRAERLEAPERGGLEDGQLLVGREELLGTVTRAFVQRPQCR